MPAPPADGGRPLRILSLYDCVYPQVLGGVEHRNHELALALAARGHAVTLAGWTDAPAAPAPGVRILPLGARRELYGAEGKRRPAAAAAYARDVAAFDVRPYDVVDTANIPYAHLPLLALRCALARRPLVVTWHEYWGPYWREYVGARKAPLFAAVERATAQLGTAATAVSRLTGDRLAARRHTGGVTVVPNGIPFARIAACAAPGAHGGAPLVYAGRLMREKRVDVLLEAVAVLAPRRAEPVVLSVVGDGPDRARLEALAGERGITERVRFHGRLPTSEDVWRHLGEARVAVQPSSREGFGMFPLEAMAAGLPVVYCASNESALGELVRAGREGEGVAPNAGALAAGIARVLEAPGAWEQLHAGVVARAREYDWDAVAARVEAVYRGVVR